MGSNNDQKRRFEEWFDRGRQYELLLFVTTVIFTFVWLVATVWQFVDRNPLTGLLFASIGILVPCIPLSVARSMKMYNDVREQFRLVMMEHSIHRDAAIEMIMALYRRYHAATLNPLGALRAFWRWIADMAKIRLGMLTFAKILTEGSSSGNESRTPHTATAELREHLTFVQSVAQCNSGQDLPKKQIGRLFASLYFILRLVQALATQNTGSQGAPQGNGPIRTMLSNCQEALTSMPSGGIVGKHVQGMIREVTKEIKGFLDRT